MKYTIVIIIFSLIILLVNINKTNIHYRTIGVIQKCSNNSHNYVNIIYNKCKFNPTGVLTTCLYGYDTKPTFKTRYIDNLIKSVKYAKVALPIWSYRVYIDPGLSTSTIDLLKNTGCELYIMKYPSKGHLGSLWRFLPACENLPFICLDADDGNFDEPNPRYLYDPKLTTYINKWLDSDKVFFQKTQFIYNLIYLPPITAKNWGGKANCIPNIQELINQQCAKWYGTDEAFLTQYVWPLFKQQGYYHTPRNGMEIAFIIFLIILMVIALIKIKMYFILY